MNSKILKEFGIKQEVFYADFNWDTVLKVSQNNKLKITALPKYPSVKRDLALLLNKEIAFKDLYNAAFQSEKQLLKEVDLFDVDKYSNMSIAKLRNAVLTKEQVNLLLEAESAKENPRATAFTILEAQL